MLKTILSALVLLCAKPLLMAQTQQFYVVAVGVSDYEGTKNDLHYADDDARKVAQFFIDLKVPSGNIKLLTDKNATHQNILSTMNAVFGAATANDVVLFYFSGHGDKGMFLPADFTGYSNELLHKEVKAAFKSCKAQHKICIADACFAGSIRTKNFEKRRDSLKLADTDKLEDKKDDAENKTKDYKAPAADIAVMMASRANETSQEHGVLQQGAFTYHLLHGWQGAADRNNDKTITIKELYEYTHTKVIKATNGEQHPVIFGRFNADMPVLLLK